MAPIPGHSPPRGGSDPLAESPPGCCAGLTHCACAPEQGVGAPVLSR